MDVGESMSQESPSSFRKHRSLFLSAGRYLVRNPLRSGLIVFCLTGVLTPFVVAIAISEGVKSQYRAVLEDGGDVYVARDHYGSNAPIELGMVEELKGIQGVTHAIPRVVGRTYVHGKFLAVLGIGPQSLPGAVHMVRGRKPQARGEVILGQEAAEYLHLGVGSRFSIRRSPSQVFEIVGLFHSSCNIWNVDLLIMPFEDGAELFHLNDKATDISIYTRPGYEEIVDVIVRLSQEDEDTGQPALRVQSKELIDRYTQRGFNIKAGVFAGLYCVALALAIPSIGVISGFGLWERKREIGVMKAFGWQTQEVLEMVALENLILSIISVPLIVVCAALWIHVGNGIPITNFVIADFDVMIPFEVPARIFPAPALLGAMLAVILTMVGSIYSTWRTAVVPPLEAMKL